MVSHDSTAMPICPWLLYPLSDDRVATATAPLSHCFPNDTVSQMTLASLCSHGIWRIASDNTFVLPAGEGQPAEGAAAGEGAATADGSAAAVVGGGAEPMDEDALLQQVGSDSGI